MASLVEKRETLTSLGCQVVLITCGVEKGARMWREETKCPLPIYLDSDGRDLFHHFGMWRGYRSVFNLHSMSNYVRKRIQDPSKIQVVPFPDVPLDPIQMGGDVIVRRESAEVLFSHLTEKSPFDREDVEKAIEIAKALQK